jgi:hypothetical protein
MDAYSHTIADTIGKNKTIATVFKDICCFFGLQTYTFNYNESIAHYFNRYRLGDSAERIGKTTGYSI